MREVKLMRQTAVRHMVKGWLLRAPCMKIVTWGTPALIRTLLILTYDGCVHLILDSKTELYLGDLLRSLGKIIPGLVICYHQSSVAIGLPGTNVDSAKLLLMEEAMLVPTKEARNMEDWFTHTLAAIWLTAIEATLHAAVSSGVQNPEKCQVSTL